MSRPEPIEYAERLYAAIRDANFSPISFLAFGNAVKDGVPMRSMPRIAAEPFMRVVGDMLDLEKAASNDSITEAEVVDAASSLEAPGEDAGPTSEATPPASTASGAEDAHPAQAAETSVPNARPRRNGARR
jgi:hypothetical protein